MKSVRSRVSFSNTSGQLAFFTGVDCCGSECLLWLRNPNSFSVVACIYFSVKYISHIHTTLYTRLYEVIPESKFLDPPTGICLLCPLRLRVFFSSCRGHKDQKLALKKWFIEDRESLESDQGVTLGYNCFLFPGNPLFMCHSNSRRLCYCVNERENERRIVIFFSLLKVMI